MRDDGTEAAARHLARHVLDLDHRKADALLKPVIGETSKADQPIENGALRVCKSFRIRYRMEGWISTAIYVLILALFVWCGKRIFALPGN